MEHRWDKSLRFHPILVGKVADDDPMAALWRERQSSAELDDIGVFGQILRSSRYILFVEDDEHEATLEAVFYAIDLNKAEMVLSRGLQIGGFADHDDVMRHLAFALAEEIPVLAETDAAQARLDALTRELLTIGFASKDTSGAPVRYRLTPAGKSVNLDDLTGEHLLAVGRQPSLSETRLVVSKLKQELDAHQAAGRVLASLRLANAELAAALADDVVEAELQAVLARHPVLFGPDYVRVIPQHRLGAEYVMDFALERAGGSFDLVEIERSTHALFKKTDGAPTAALAHAEQQVLDWLAWTERHGTYVRERLVGLTRPRGWIVIGRSIHRRVGDEQRQVQRNAVLAPALHILTWDQLLQRGQHLLELLEGGEPITS